MHMLPLFLLLQPRDVVLYVFINVPLRILFGVVSTDVFSGSLLSFLSSIESVDDLNEAFFILVTGVFPALSFDD